MYVYIKGILKKKDVCSAVIENCGIGYEVKIGAFTYNELPDPPEEVMLYIFHYLREDAEELYGFSGESEKKLFEVILTVSKIGPGKALNIISQITPPEFSAAVRSEDIGRLSAIKGIGKKTAQRMIVDLKDKIVQIIPAGYEKKYGVGEREKLQETLSALIALGYKETRAREMIDAVRESIDEKDLVEDIISKVFKRNG